MWRMMLVCRGESAEFGQPFIDRVRGLVYEAPGLLAELRMYQDVCRETMKF